MCVCVCVGVCVFVCVCVCVCVCVFVCVFVFVCLFVWLVEPVLLTTIDSGLQGPRGPFSTTVGDWGLLFKVGKVGENLKELKFVYRIDGGIR